MSNKEREDMDPAALDAGESALDEQELARAVSRVIEALRPVLEDLADDPTE